MSSSTLTTFDALMKELYVPQDVVLRAYKRSKLLAALPKMQDFQGREMPVPIWYEAGQGISHTFAKAQANASASKSKAFLLTRKRHYGIGELDNELMLATRAGGRDGKAAFRKAVDEINALSDAITLELGFKLYRGRDAVRGRIGAITDGAGEASVTLKVRGDIAGIFLGMKLVACRGDQGPAANAPRNSGAAHTVIRIDRKAGTFVVDATAAATDGWTASGSSTTDHVSGASGDWLYREGDHVTANDNLSFSGLADWLPLSVASSGDSFYGVDRASDPSRLAGIPVDASAYGTVREALIDAAMYAREQNVAPSVCALHPAQLSRLIKECDGKVQYQVMQTGPGSAAKFGFEVVRLDTPAGPVSILDDTFCPMNHAFMLNMDTWKFCTIGDAPMMLTYGEGEGLKWLRETDEDAVEYRFGTYGNLACPFPGGNVHIVLPAAA